MARSTDTTGWEQRSRLHLHPPVVPRQIFQAGANYHSHTVEITLAQRADHDTHPQEKTRAEVTAHILERGRTGAPFVFAGAPTALTGPDGIVHIPAGVTSLDWELELCAVIGAPAHQVKPEHTLQHVAAYTIANDVTVRERLPRPDILGRGLDWVAGKNAPAFLPAGPLPGSAAQLGDLKLCI